MQIRLELRWLQAPIIILILLFTIAITGNLNLKGEFRYSVLLLVTLSFLLTNYYYVKKGSKNLYYTTTATIGNAFDKAVKDSVINMKSTKLYLLEKRRNYDRENEIKWALGNGYFFSQYNSKGKNLVFFDSIIALKDFNKAEDQILLVDVKNDDMSFKYMIQDLTDQYINDSLKTFFTANFFTKRETYQQGYIKINENNLNHFRTNGFYEPEQGIQWTNGSSSIEFLGDFFVNDSVTVTLNTYLPPICKNINPKVSIVDTNGNVRDPLSSIRHGDTFIFTFHFSKEIPVYKIRIDSEKIDAYPDVRTLSFPFINLEVKTN